MSADAAGIIKNGVIMSVRAMLWPRNFRSSNTAKKSPTSNEQTTENAVKPTVAIIAGSKSPVLKT